MPILGSNALTLTDWGNRLDPNGKTAKITEILTQQNSILEEMLWMEGNLPTGHKSTIRAGLPSAAFRKLNYGVKPSKSQTKQVTDVCGMLETYCEIDKKLADLNGNTSEFKLSESYAFTEAMSQRMAATLFYGNLADDEAAFTGLGVRYSRLTRENASFADTSDYVINAGGTGSKCTSIWLPVFGENSIHGIFPKGSKAGLQMEDKGQVTLEDPEGGRYEGYRIHYAWEAGLAVRDFRQCVRIANIDTTSLANVDLVGHIVDAVERIHNLSSGKAVMYANRQVLTALRNQIRKTDNVHLTLQDVAGKKVTHFDDVPVRRVDAIVNTEKAIS